MAAPSLGARRSLGSLVQSACSCSNRVVVQVPRSTPHHGSVLGGSSRQLPTASILAAARQLATGSSSSSSGRGALSARAASSQAAVETPAAAAEQPAEPIELLTSDESDDLLRIRHSCAHIMAKAVQKLFPQTKVTIGPWVEYGFYYDFDIPDHALTDKDLKKIKAEMQRVCKLDLPLVREEVSIQEAAARIEAQGEPYKAEILADITARDPAAAITIYHIGEPGSSEHWWDLCAGPHVPSTGAIAGNAIDLESIAGAYWRGDESRQQLQRIYGTAWQSREQLQAYSKMKEEAARRDHRKLGADLDLFSINEAVGGGLVFWHPRGAMVRHVIEGYWKDIHLADGYQLLFTPHIAKLDLWKTSGHYEFYGENMFDQMDVESEQYQLRPMNCPFHIAVYNKGQRSYRDLPIRWAELGTVYRYERSGTMHGLFRVRGFTQDDAHIFCLPEQIEAEILGVLNLVEQLLGAFGFTTYEVNLSTRPEKSVGSDDVWQRAEAALGAALDAKGWAYAVDDGGGAFYGPKIDIKIRDAIGRKWQCSTVQLDFNLPERFDMSYTDADNVKQRPIMIHRAIFGSLERFFGILVENYAGAFPLWMAPVQVQLLPVVDDVLPFANEVMARLAAAGVRAELRGGERIGKLIRNAETAKVPVMCVIGKKEVEAGALSVRTYAGGELGQLPVEQLVQLVAAAAAARGDTIAV